MTILNAIVSPEKVLLSADTLTRLQHSGKESKTTKIFLLPHLRAIIAGTGTNELAPALQMTLLNVPDFDTAEIMLRSAISELYSKIKNQDRVKIAERQGIFIAGLSVSRDRFIGRWAFQMNELNGFEIHEVEFLLTPWEGPYPPAPSTDRDLVELARHQYKIFQATRPDAVFGGDLVVAELTKNAIKLENAWDMCRDKPAGCLIDLAQRRPIGGDETLGNLLFAHLAKE